MANLKYNKGFFELLSGNLNFGTDSFKVMLVTSTYTPATTHNFRSDVTNEVAGTGYTAGGKTTGTITVTEDDGGNKAYIDCPDIVWGASTITARAAILYKDTGVAATDILVAYYDFGSDQSSRSGDFTLSINANGLLDVS